MVKKSDIKQILNGIKLVDTTRDRIYNDLKCGEDIVYVFDNGLHIAIKDNDYIYSYFLDYREKENCIKSLGRVYPTPRSKSEILDIFL